MLYGSSKKGVAMKNKNLEKQGMKWARTAYLTKSGLAAYNRVSARFAGEYVAPASTFGNWAWKLLDKITADRGLKAGDDVKKILGI